MGVGADARSELSLGKNPAKILLRLKSSSSSGNKETFTDFQKGKKGRIRQKPEKIDKWPKNAKMAPISHLTFLGPVASFT